jgi:hypothetical protein
MKRGTFFSILLFIFVTFSFVNVNAARCTLSANLINQDPYPAVPGDYVEVVFQLNGVGNPECNGATFEVIEKYPFKLDDQANAKRILEGPTYSKDYKNSWVIPYDLRIDENALEASQPIEVVYSSRNTKDETKISEKFNISIEDSRADFEIFVKNYEVSTSILTLEIINIEEVDVEGLTLEIENQQNIKMKGSKVNIVGDLDSNEYTTAEFEAIPQNGEIDVKIRYTDQIGVRRSITKTIEYESEYFIDRNGDQNINIPSWVYIVAIILIAGIAYWIYRRCKKKKRK